MMLGYQEKDSQKNTTVSDDVFIDQLTKAYDSFITLKSSMEEANKFYNDFVGLITNFEKEVSDFCSASKTEKECLLKSLAGEPSTSVQPTPSG